MFHTYENVMKLGNKTIYTTRRWCSLIILVVDPALAATAAAASALFCVSYRSFPRIRSRPTEREEDITLALEKHTPESGGKRPEGNSEKRFQYFMEYPTSQT